ncbi:MAG: Transcriptional regulator, AraC family, partial [uncultured Rubrobacteraceae bacterium]
ALGSRPRYGWGFGLRPFHPHRGLRAHPPDRRARGLPGAHLRPKGRGRRGRLRRARPLGAGCAGRGRHHLRARPGRPYGADTRGCSGGATHRGTKRRPDRVDLRGGFHPRRQRAPKQPARDHPLGRGQRTLPPLPGGLCGRGRALRRQRADPHLRRRRRWARSVPAHDPPGPRLHGGSRRRPDGRDVPRARGRAGPIHRPRAARRARLKPRAAAAVDGRERPQKIDPPRDRRAGEDEHSHPKPALPRADRDDPAAMVVPVANPRGPTLAGNHTASGRADRPRGGVRLADELPGSLQACGGHQPAGLPAGVRRCSPAHV